MQMSYNFNENHRTWDSVSDLLLDLMEIRIVSYFFDMKSLDFF